jgi:hypothetical protein
MTGDIRGLVQAPTPIGIVELPTTIEPSAGQAPSAESEQMPPIVREHHGWAHYLSVISPQKL